MPRRKTPSMQKNLESINVKLNQIIQKIDDMEQQSANLINGQCNQIMQRIDDMQNRPKCNCLFQNAWKVISIFMIVIVLLSAYWMSQNLFCDHYAGYKEKMRCQRECGNMRDQASALYAMCQNKYEKDCNATYNRLMVCDIFFCLLSN